MKTLLFDNYDSFTYNIANALRELGIENLSVARNDKISVEEMRKFDKIIFSPGPGIPKDAGVMESAIKELAPEKTILGVCLGHQAIGEVFGAKLENLSRPFHAVQSQMKIVKTTPLFNGLSDGFLAGRYHSWVVSKENFPDCLEISAVEENGQIMALRHKQYNVFGLQFHPESILTPEGAKILDNFLKL